MCCIIVAGSSSSDFVLLNIMRLAKCNETAARFGSAGQRLTLPSDVEAAE